MDRPIEPNFSYAPLKESVIIQGERDRVFNLVKADMDRAMHEMQAVLLREIYRSTPGPPVPPLTRRQQFARRWQRIRAYWWTLGRALRGDDPYAVEEEEY